MSDKKVFEEEPGTRMTEIDPSNARQVVDMIAPAMMPLLGDLLKEKLSEQEKRQEKSAADTVRKQIEFAVATTSRALSHVAEMLIRFDQVVWQEGRVENTRADLEAAYVGTSDGWRLEIAAFRKPGERETSLAAYIQDVIGGAVVQVEDRLAKRLVGVAEEWLWKNGRKKENGHVGDSRNVRKAHGKRKAVRRKNRSKR